MRARIGKAGLKLLKAPGMVVMLFSLGYAEVAASPIRAAAGPCKDVYPRPPYNDMWLYAPQQV